MRNTIFFFLWVVCLLAACASTSQTSKTKASSEQIRFGSGGGFTGGVTEYCVLNTGKLYIRKAFEDTEKLKASQQDIDSCFAASEKIGFKAIDFNKPGNTYSFIELRSGDSIHRVTFNPHQPNLPKDIVQFNNMLLQLVGEPPMVEAKPLLRLEEGPPTKDNKKKVLSNGNIIQKRSAIDAPKKKLKIKSKNKPIQKKQEK